MARRRFRRRRGTWLPALPTFFGSSTTGATFFESTLTLDAGLNAGVDGNPVEAIPLVTDVTQEPDDAGGGAIKSLRDVVEGQEYVLERAVGKIWCSLDQNGAEGTKVARVIVCIAMAVMPVLDGNPDAPALPFTDIDPLRTDNTMAPWLWRRTWTLGRSQANDERIQYPYSNEAFGSMSDGPHVDTKGVRRRIRKEERLFLVASAAKLTSTGTDIEAIVNYGYDLRFFGALRRAHNRSVLK